MTVNNQIDFSRGGEQYAQGTIDLRGDRALTYVRERKSFSDGDYQRVRNQQAFIKGVVDKLLSRETLTDPGRIAESVDAFPPYLTVDAGTIGTLALGMTDLKKDDIVFLRLDRARQTLRSCTVSTAWSAPLRSTRVARCLVGMTFSTRFGMLISFQ